MTASPSEVTASWMRSYVPAPDAPTRLVCLPHAGGAASFWLPAARALGTDTEVLAVQYPGRQDRRHEPCVTRLPVLAERIHDVLTSLPPKPTALLGHSMGATLAFEIATLMEPTAPAVHLFVSGRRAPSVTRDETVHLRDDAGLLAEVRALAGTDGRLLDDDEVMRMALPAIRGDYTAAETYRWVPGDRLSCPVTAYTGDADPKVEPDEVRAWERHTTGPFGCRVLPGGHFFLTDHAATVIAEIRAALA